MEYGGKITAKKTAYCAVMCALLIAAQFAFGAVSGVEIVTILLLTFSAYFGAACGVLTAVAFSLLRCFIYGFYPAVIILYLIYYPVFALFFALLGKTDGEPTVLKLICINALFAATGGACAVVAALKIIKTSAVYAKTINVLLWVICGICSALIIAFNAIYVAVKRKKLSKNFIILFLMCGAACAFTAAFTLLDDIITPLFLGMTKEGALTYFYASFIAMLPQIICSAATTLLLYFPITLAYSKACPKPKCIDKRAKKL